MRKQTNMLRTKKSGFTLIELLLVIGIIAVLAGVVFVALDPAKRFQDARDARRLTDIENILAAVHQYVVDNKGAFPAGIDTTEKQIGAAASGCALCDGPCCVGGDGDCVDLSNELSRYLKTIPYDPSAGTADLSHYSIQLDNNNFVTVTACDAEALAEPSVSR